MRIITVNLPKAYIDAMNNLVGEKGLYPSRSELVRVAVREFLIRELEAAQYFEETYKGKTFKVVKTNDDIFLRVKGQSLNDDIPYKIVNKEGREEQKPERKEINPSKYYFDKKKEEMENDPNWFIS